MPAWRKGVPTPPSGWPAQEHLEDHYLESPFELCAFHLTIERSGQALAPLDLSCPNREEGPMSLGRKRRPLLRSRVSRHIAGEECGAEIVEFAVVLPALLMLLIGMIWLGRAYNIYETITRAAREGARYAGAPTCAKCASPNTSPNASQVQAVVDASLTVSALDPTQKTNYSFQTGVTLNPASDATETGVIISFGYPMKLVIPFTSLNASTITISTRVQMRQEKQ